MVKLETDKELIFIVDKLKFCWVLIPKCASNSLTIAISDAIINAGIPKKGKRTLLNYFHEGISNLENHPEYFKFVFVRNPWDRLVSCYCNRFSDQFFEGTYGKTSYAPKEFKLMGIHKDMSFNNFVNVICEQDDYNSDRHWRSQHCSIMTNKIMVDFIGKVENIQLDWRYVCGMMNWNYTKLPRKKTSDHTHYNDYYNTITKEQVRKRYEKDIDLFKYTY